MRGIDRTHPAWAQARAFADNLRQHLALKLPARRSVVVDETLRDADAFSGKRPEFAVNLDFVPVGSECDCALFLQHFASKQVLQTSHLVLGSEPENAIAELAEAFVETLWGAMTAPQTRERLATDVPLPVRIELAARHFTDGAGWTESMRRLRMAIATAPDNHELAVMLASSLHGKYIQGEPKLFLEEDSRAADQAEIKRLVLSALPHIRDNTELTLTAAKLLQFVNEEHRDAALEMAETAFRTTTAVASAYATLAQLRMFEGQFEDAAQLLDAAIPLSKPDTDFRFYLLVIKCQIEHASGDPGRAARAFDTLAEQQDAVANYMATFYATTPAQREKYKVLQRVSQYDPDLAVATLRYRHFVYARLCPTAALRARAMEPILGIVRRFFGDAIVPDEIWKDLRD